MTPVLETIVGNRSAAQVLLFLESYGSGYASGIASTFEVPVMAVQRQLKRLEAGGVLVSRMVGTSRVFEFNERNPTVLALRSLLREELNVLPQQMTKRYFRQRQRPRRSGKAL
ncbi:MAG: ArsR family transcriptional regulator [Pseudomonadota bacterium]